MENTDLDSVKQLKNRPLMPDGFTMWVGLIIILCGIFMWFGGKTMVIDQTADAPVWSAVTTLTGKGEYLVVVYESASSGYTELSMKLTDADGVETLLFGAFTEGEMVWPEKLNTIEPATRGPAVGGHSLHD